MRAFSSAKHLLRSLLVLVSALLLVGQPAVAEDKTIAVTEDDTPEALRLYQAFYTANGCEAAYQTGEDVGRMLKAMGIEQFRFLDFGHEQQMSDTQILVASLQNYTLVCFRGTQERADWRTSLALSTQNVRFDERFPIVKVHSGFYAAWLEVRPALVGYLHEVGVKKMFDGDLEKGEKCHELLIGGHSLGGALATLAGVDLILQGYPVLGVYTFGQPKVFGDGIEATEWASLDKLVDMQRFVLRGDPVPALPPGYKHFGHERYSKDIGSILEIARPEWFWPVLNDHRMSNYVKTLAALLSTRSTSQNTTGILQWLKARNAPLTDFLRLTPRQAEDIAIAISTKGKQPFTVCARRVPVPQ